MIFFVFTLILSCLNWGYVREFVVTNKGAEIVTPGEDILISVNTQILINQQKLLSDCSDLKITDENNNEYVVFNEGSCDTVRTQFWIHMETVRAGDTTLLIWYNDNVEKGKRDTWDGNTVLMFDSICPLSFNLHDIEDDHRYPRGGSGIRGGSLTHSHTISNVNFAVTDQGLYTTLFTTLENDGTQDFSSEAHIHRCTDDVDITDANNLPSSYSLRFCDGQEGELKVYENSVEMFLTTTLPNSYTSKTELNDYGRFAYYDADSVGDEHDQGNHNHNISKNSNIQNPTPYDGIYDKNGGDQYSAENHDHQMRGTMNNENVVPPYYYVHFAHNSYQIGRNVEPGSILILTSQPPKGYKLVDDLNNRFPRGSLTNLGTYQDNVDHTHNYDLETKLPTGTNRIKTQDSETGRVCHTNHIHTQLNLVSGVEDHIPEYFFVQFYQKIKNSDIEVRLGNESPICAGFPSYSNYTCNSVSPCISPDTCNCSSLYFGYECESCDSDYFCSPHSYCLTNFGLHDCFCIKGWYGINCETCNSTYVCNNHGTSCSDNTGSTVCVCDQYYYGNFCNDCDDDFFCRSRGTCENDTCVCDNFFSGNNCEICDGNEFCNGQSSECSNVNNEIVCTCNNNNYFGDECEFCNVTEFCNTSISDTCYNFKDVIVCNCAFYPGFYGPECNTPYECFDLQANHSDVCNGNGECFYTDNCQCFPNNDYYGLFCSEYIPSGEFVSLNEIEVVYVCDEQYLPASPFGCDIVIQNVGVVGQGAICQFNVPGRRASSDVLKITLGTGATITGESPNDILQVKSITDTNEFAQLIISPFPEDTTDTEDDTTTEGELPAYFIPVVASGGVLVLLIVIIICIVFWCCLTILVLKKKKKGDGDIALLEDNTLEKSDSGDEKEKKIDSSSMNEEMLLKEIKKVEENEKKIKEEIEKKSNEIKKQESELHAVKKENPLYYETTSESESSDDEKESDDSDIGNKSENGLNDSDQSDGEKERKKKLDILSSKIAHFKRTSLAKVDNNEEENQDD